MGLLEIIVIVLLILWLMGAFVFPVGSIVHVLLIIVIVLVILRLLQGRRVV